MRRGAGKLLLSKGAEIAEREGLDTWLLASQEGRPLYEKVGFRLVEGGRCEDLVPQLGEGALVHVVMMRPLHEKAVAEQG